ncbi:MAG: hypothetical protein IJV94_03750 [Bacilli bacterium]|nr:hypothetical protein [Bacilli bacterium]
MFNPNEEIQIIAYNVDGPLEMAEQMKIEKALTDLNKELTLKNRYTKAIDKLERIKNELEQKVMFCTNEADGTVNDTNCRIAIQFYKHLLDIINER